jgi:hypothetical protein
MLGYHQVGKLEGLRLRVKKSWYIKGFKKLEVKGIRRRVEKGLVKRGSL